MCLEIIKEALTSSIGIFIAIFFAGIIWFIKSAYEKHRAELFALAKFERMFANNIMLLRDNFEFIDEWLGAIKSGRPYSFQFGNFFINEEETYKLSNLKLINKILSINYKLRRTNLDINNIYKSYWEVIFKIDSIQNEKQREDGLIRYHKTIQQTLEKIKTNHDPLKKDLIDVQATIIVAANIRLHSLFGHLNFLFRDIFPRITDKAIKTEIEILNKKLKEIETQEHKTIPDQDTSVGKSENR